MIKRGLLPVEIGYWLNKEALSYIYGWTPKEIDEMPLETMLYYTAILTGKSKKLERERSGLQSRVERKEMR